MSLVDLIKQATVAFHFLGEVAEIIILGDGKSQHIYKEIVYFNWTCHLSKTKETKLSHWLT